MNLQGEHLTLDLQVGEQIIQAKELHRFLDTTSLYDIETLVLKIASDDTKTKTIEYQNSIFETISKFAPRFSNLENFTITPYESIVSNNLPNMSVCRILKSLKVDAIESDVFKDIAKKYPYLENLSVTNYIGTEKSIHYSFDDLAGLPLTHLNIANTYCQTLPKVLTQLPHLHSLTAYNNEITEIPKFLSNTYLKSLDLAHNQIERLENLPIHSLGKLDVSNNKISSIDRPEASLILVNALMGKFQGIGNIGQINLSNNRLTPQSLTPQIWREMNTVINVRKIAQAFSFNEEQRKIVNDMIFDRLPRVKNHIAM